MIELDDHPAPPRQAAPTPSVADEPTAGYPLPGGAITALGEWFVRRGMIDRAELFTALDVSYRHQCRIGDALVWLETLDRRQVEREARRFHAHVARGRRLSAAEPRATTGPPTHGG